MAAALVALQLALAALYYLVTRRRGEIMLVDFYSYRPPDRRAPSAFPCQGGWVYWALLLQRSASSTSLPAGRRPV